MVILPAIDIKDGNCVRLLQGRFSDVTVYGDNPAEMAKKWEAGVGPIREQLRPVLDRLAKEKQYGSTTVFRYEHPDLVREGIVFEGSGSV